MPNHSDITIVGHLGRDAETKQVGSSTVTEFTVAVNHRDKKGDTTMWFSCALWGKRGEAVAQYLTKGKAVLVSGRFWVRDYEGKNGPSYSLEVNANDLVLLGGKDDAAAPPAHNDDIPF